MKLKWERSSGPDWFAKLDENSRIEVQVNNLGPYWIFLTEEDESFYLGEAAEEWEIAGALKVAETFAGLYLKGQRK